jgi:CBS domain containing-hemolysin-like protein
MMSWLPFAIAAVCLVLEAFFSSSEIAIVSADRALMRRRAEEGSRGARQVERFLVEPHRLLAITLLGTQLSVVTSTVVITLWLYEHHRAHAELYLTLFLTPVIVIFGEIVPKAIVRQHSSVFAPRMALILYATAKLLAPAVALLSALALWTQKRLGIDLHQPLVTREEIETLVDSPSTPSSNATPSPVTDVTEGERSMISRILDLRGVEVHSVMVPLSDITALPETATIAALAREIADKKYSRIPIYRDRIDQIVGVVHAFDVLKAARSPGTAADLMRSPTFVPESSQAMELLTKLERARQGMAIVVDEYGGAVGAVTVEDILEEVVGEIDDEYDEAPPLINRQKDGSYRVMARVSVEQLNRELLREFGPQALPESDDYESLAGLLLDRLRHIPKPGELVRLGNLSIEVLSANERRIEEVLIRLAKKR